MMKYLLAFLIAMALGLLVYFPNNAQSAPVRNYSSSFNWQIICPTGSQQGYVCINRMKTPYGWLVMLNDHLTYVPDPQHDWLKG